MKLTCEHRCTCAFIKKLLIDIEKRLERFLKKKKFVKIRETLCDELSCIFMHYMITRAKSVNEIESYYTEIEFQLLEYLNYFKKSLKVSNEIAFEYFLNNFNPYEEAINWNIKDITLELTNTKIYDSFVSDIVEVLCFITHHKYNVDDLIDFKFLSKCIEHSFRNIDEVRQEIFKSKFNLGSIKDVIDLQPRITSVLPDTTVNYISDLSDNDI